MVLLIQEASLQHDISALAILPTVACMRREMGGMYEGSSDIVGRGMSINNRKTIEKLCIEEEECNC